MIAILHIKNILKLRSMGNYYELVDFDGVKIVEDMSLSKDELINLINTGRAVYNIDVVDGEIIGINPEISDYPQFNNRYAILEEIIENNIVIGYTVVEFFSVIHKQRSVVVNQLINQDMQHMLEDKNGVTCIKGTYSRREATHLIKLEMVNRVFVESGITTGFDANDVLMGNMEIDDVSDYSYFLPIQMQRLIFELSKMLLDNDCSRILSEHELSAGKNAIKWMNSFNEKQKEIVDAAYLDLKESIGSNFLDQILD